MIAFRKNTYICFLGFMVMFPARSSAKTYTAVSCSRTDVGAAVSAASIGDTVTVPAGNCTWSSPLSITKGIILQGAGAGSTNITADVGGNYLIIYQPTDLAANAAFRLTGFSFNLQNANAGWNINITAPTPQTKIRIDHNTWTNCVYAHPFLNEGPIYGLIDHNIFSGAPHLDNYGLKRYEGNGGQYEWGHYSRFVFGAANNLYYENNTFNTADIILSGGLGGRYVFRYNTVNNTVGLWPMLDVHGNMSVGGNNSTMGVEVYGNHVTNASQDARVLDLRGGMGVAYYNYVAKSGGMDLQLREEHCDSLTPPASTPDGQPQHISNSYFWNNRDSKGLKYFRDARFYGDTYCASYLLANNVDYWDFNPNFNGTSGTGCGTLAARPATCSTGVGYWATNQSCSTIPTASVGVEPTDPLSGTLYKCTATNTWTSYYKPYPYPHPLSQGGSQQSKTPTSPSNVMVQSLAK